MVADAQGQPVRFSLIGRQRADVSQAIPLLTGIETGAVIADCDDVSVPSRLGSDPIANWL